MIVALSVLWGSAFMMVKVALDGGVPALTLVAGRFAGAVLVLGLVLLVTRQRLRLNRDALAAFLVLGVVNNVWPFVLLTWGQERIDSSLAAILTASMPLSTVILAHFWIGERITLDRVVGVLVGFCGVFLLIGTDLRDITESSTLGQLAIIAGVLGYSTGTVYARRYLQQDVGGDATAAGQMLVGTMVMVPLALAVETPFDLSISAKTALAWSALGVLPSAIAYMIYYRLLRDVTATQASMIGYLIPITAVSLGAFVLDERLAATSFAGLALIIVGVWVVNGGGLWLAQRVERRGIDITPVRGGGNGADG